MALMPVADALSAVLDGATAVARRERGARRRASPGAGARSRRRCGPSRRRRCRRWTAMRCAPPTSPPSPARLTVIGEIAAGRPGRRCARHRRGAADLHRRRGAGRRRHRGDPGGHRSRRRHRDRQRGGADSAATSAPPESISTQGDVLLRAGRPAQRPRPLARRRHEPSDAAGAPPAARGDARHRRRTGDAGHRRPARARSSIPTATRCAALARDEGAEVIDLGIAADTVEATTAAIRRARDARRRSAGHHRRRIGRRPRSGQARRSRPKASTIAFWKIAMRPGKPMMHGRLGAMRVIGLPGNPVSSYVCAFLFMVPLIRALCGTRDIGTDPPNPRVLGRDVAANDQREDYLRAHARAPTPTGGWWRRRSTGRIPRCWRSVGGPGADRPAAIRARGDRPARPASSVKLPL